MKLTAEQAAIIQSEGNIKINAVAGSGKTTTVIEYAKARPAQSRILYLAFNKSVKTEAVKKFAEKGLKNVTVETAHSLAYKNIVFKYQYKVRQHGYKTNEVAALLSLENNGEKHYEYIVANHINKFISYFCNSDVAKVQDLNYLDIVTDKKAKTFIKSFYPFLEMQTRILLAKMDKGEIEITHDFYLKKFQLSNPQLGYDYILFDEGQDASAAMLDIFLKQQATKVIVGDTHQQIYGWRHAVNSLEKTDFKTFHLTESFRFSNDIAQLAAKALELKDLIEPFAPVVIKGQAKTSAGKSKAVLARTNLGLLLKAIEIVTENRKVTSLYFEGNINSYTYADEGASLYDILNLYNGKRSMIRDELIKSMKSMDELEEYIEKAEDPQLGMMAEIVKEYGNEIPGILKLIKDKHVPNDEKEKADIIFSTVHRCKGMEYDDVELVNDFINEEKLQKRISEKDFNEGSIPNLNEEINLLYVAITRTKNTLQIPEQLLPVGFPASPKIIVIKKPAVEEQKKEPEKKSFIFQKQSELLSQKPKKKWPSEGAREGNADAYRPWTESMDGELKRMFEKGETMNELSETFGRTKGAVYARLKKLGISK